MKFKLKIEGDVIALLVTEVEDTDDARGRIACIEIELLRLWGSHVSEPVRRGTDGKLMFHIWTRCGASARRLYDDARHVLHGFNIEV